MQICNIIFITVLPCLPQTIAINITLLYTHLSFCTICGHNISVDVQNGDIKAIVE